MNEKRSIFTKWFYRIVFSLELQAEMVHWNRFSQIQQIQSVPQANKNPTPYNEELQST